MLTGQPRCASRAPGPTKAGNAAVQQIPRHQRWRSHEQIAAARAALIKALDSLIPLDCGVEGPIENAQIAAHIQKLNAPRRCALVLRLFIAFDKACGAVPQALSEDYKTQLLYLRVIANAARFSHRGEMRLIAWAVGDAIAWQILCFEEPIARKVEIEPIGQRKEEARDCIAELCCALLQFFQNVGTVRRSTGVHELARRLRQTESENSSILSIEIELLESVRTIQTLCSVVSHNEAQKEGNGDLDFQVLLLDDKLIKFAKSQSQSRKYPNLRQEQRLAAICSLCKKIVMWHCMQFLLANKWITQGKVDEYSDFFREILDSPAAFIRPIWSFFKDPNDFQDGLHDITPGHDGIILKTRLQAGVMDLIGLEALQYKAPAVGLGFKQWRLANEVMWRDALASKAFGRPIASNLETVLQLYGPLIEGDVGTITRVVYFTYAAFFLLQVKTVTIKIDPDSFQKVFTAIVQSVSDPDFLPALDAAAMAERSLLLPIEVALSLAEIQDDQARRELFLELVNSINGLTSIPFYSPEDVGRIVNLGGEQQFRFHPCLVNTLAERYRPFFPEDTFKREGSSLRGTVDAYLSNLFMRKLDDDARQNIHTTPVSSLLGAFLALCTEWRFRGPVDVEINGHQTAISHTVCQLFGAWLLDIPTSQLYQLLRIDALSTETGDIFFPKDLKDLILLAGCHTNKAIGDFKTQIDQLRAWEVAEEKRKTQEVGGVQ